MPGCPYANMGHVAPAKLERKALEDPEEPSAGSSSSVAQIPLALEMSSLFVPEEAVNGAHLRPIFFYNDMLNLGSTLRLNLFEPRYRIMVQRVMATHRQILYLPNFVNYIPNHGDIGMIAEIGHCVQHPDGRAEIEATTIQAVMILSYWVEPNTHGLYFALCMPVPAYAPIPQDELNKFFGSMYGSSDGLYRADKQEIQVYVEPTHEAPVISTLKYGDVVNALDVRGNWIKHEGGWTQRWDERTNSQALLPLTTVMSQIRKKSKTNIRIIHHRTPETHVIVRGTTSNIDVALDMLKEQNPNAISMVISERLSLRPLVNVQSLILLVQREIDRSMTICPPLSTRTDAEILSLAYQMQIDSTSISSTEEVLQRIRSAMCDLRLRTELLHHLPGLDVWGMAGKTVRGFISRCIFEPPHTYYMDRSSLFAQYLRSAFEVELDASFMVLECVVDPHQRFQSSFVALPTMTEVDARSATRMLRSVSRRLNYPRIRQLWIGHRQKDCRFHQLPYAVLKTVMSFLLHTHNDSVARYDVSSN